MQQPSKAVTPTTFFLWFIMNMKQTDQKVDINTTIRRYVEEKLERVIRHFDQIIEIEVLLGIETPSEKDIRQRAEVNLRVKGNVFHLDHYAEDLYVAFVGLVVKLDRQVLKYLVFFFVLLCVLL